MKRLLAMVAAAVLAARAPGAGVEFRLGATDGAAGSFPEGPGVTLQPSQGAEIEAWATGLDLYAGYRKATIGFDTEPPLVEDFTLEGAIPGPEQYGTTYTPGEPGPGTDIQLNDLRMDMYSYPYAYGFTEMLLTRLVIHCCGTGYTVISFDSLQGEAAIYHFDHWDQPYDIDFTLARFVVNQIPEPASLALLALGGLALIRRR